MNPTDQALLELFRTTNDQAAFEQLVQRHGPMVMGICRRLLGNEQDAWDAFQSVFLALARKADSLQKHPALSGWLHQVAIYTAKDARISLLRRNSRFQPWEEDMMQEPTTPESGEEWGISLDEEIQRLPDKYRFPVILCHVEKRTYEEAAEELKLSYAVLRHRLYRATDLLRSRLLRRGIGVTGAAMGMLLAKNALAQVPADSALLTAKVASSFAAGAAETGLVESGAVSTKVMGMMKGGLKLLWIQQLKSAALTGLVSLGAGAAVLAVAWHIYAKTPAAIIQNKAAAATVAQSQGQILFQESFEDDSFASRGWYDNTSIVITAAEHIPGSNRAMEFHFQKGASTPPPGGSMRKLFAETDSVYVSYWVKYSTNYVGSGKSHGIQEFYLLTNEDEAWTGLSWTHLFAAIEQNKGTPVLWLCDGKDIDISRIDQDLTKITENRAIAGGNGVPSTEQVSSVVCYPVGGGEYRNGKSFRAEQAYFQDQYGPGYKGDWHHVEAYIKLNTLSDGKGNFDGVLRYWYDGQLIIERTNVIMRTGMHPDMKFNQFVIAPYIVDGSPVDQAFWVDNLTVAMERP